MKIVRAVPLILLFGSVAFSQETGKQFSTESQQASCPAEVKATFWVPGKTVPVVPVANTPAKRNDRWLRITLSNPESQVVAARFTVHGYPAGLRLDPAVFYLANDPHEIRKTVAFNTAVAPGHASSIETPVQDFSTLTSIDLDEVTYSDGTVWHRENTMNSCRAVSAAVDVAALKVRR